MITLDNTLRDQYIKQFNDCVIKPTIKDSNGRIVGINYESEVKGFINQLMSGVEKYSEVTNVTKVPWFVVGLLHGMECSFSFKRHLHNGDSLNHRTVNVPSGRPKQGDPPFLWLVSAIDALQYDSFTAWNDWSVAGICFKLEGYNGWGYRSHHINSPYLWSYSNNYERGKYVADGHWDANAVSKQVGAIVALKKMVNDNLVKLPTIET